MAIRVYCDDPEKLLTKIKAAINNGQIDTWNVDGDGDFTHSPNQWAFLAWLRPHVFDDHIRFNILGNKSKNMSKVVYGVYHGRFIEMLLAHFDEEFSRASATALPSKGDVLP